MSGHFDDFAPVPYHEEHRCHFDAERHVRCACGWRSPSIGAAAVAESFDHFAES